MGKAKSNPFIAAAVIAVLAMDEITKLSLKERCEKFAEKATASSRAFIEMGKLHYAILGGLKKNQTIYGELRKLGVKDSTISNASYASRVYGDLVAPGHITEAAFDGFTFSDCLAIARVTGGNSKKKLDLVAVATVIADRPQDFDTEFQSIYETGLTVEEAAAKADADAKAAKKAADEAEARKIADAARKLAEQNAKDAAKTAPTPTTEAKPNAAPQAGTPAPQAPKAETPAAEPPAPEAETETETPAPAPAPTNVVPMPPQQQAAPKNPDDKLPALLATLDEVLMEAADLSVDAKKAVFLKLAEISELLGEDLAAATKPAAPAPKKNRKKAA